jgi:IS5 family transposase
MIPTPKGRLGRRTEFGYKTQLVDNVDGLILDHTTEVGNPPDSKFIEPAVARLIDQFKTPPGEVTADRGYGYASVDKALIALGVGYVAIPRAGQPGKARQGEQGTDRFIELVKWRTGCEGRISASKREHGMRRTRVAGEAGARGWVSCGVLAHNLAKGARLLVLAAAAALESADP